MARIATLVANNKWTLTCKILFKVDTVETSSLPKLNVKPE